MAKSGGKKSAGKTRREVLEELDMCHSESEDERLGKELDRGRKGAGHETDDDDMEEEEVMGFDGGDDEDEEESDEGEEGDDDLDEDELDDSDAEHDARLAKLAKKMEHRVKLQQAGSDEEGEEEEGDEDAGTAAWSKQKQDYYGADVVDAEAESDEELLKEEEQEVERLEARRAAGLTNRDFELSGSSGDEESEDEEDGCARGGKAGARQVEVVEKELGQMTDEERRAAVQRDAPELEALLEELRGALREVRHRVGPLLQEVRGGEVATQQGVSYLEAKHLLLLQYCAAIVFYLLLKAEGRPVRDHPVVLRLVALRGYLEKIRPIDRKLQHQMQKLLQAARVAQEQEGGGEEGGEDAGAKEQDFGPRPELLVPKVPGAAADAAEAAANGTSAANGVYRPPKINPVAMDDDPDKPTLSRDDRRRLVQARRRAARSQLVRELVEELEGAPEEQRAVVAGMESVAAIRQRQRLEARAAEEEDLFTRVPLSKEELKKLKANRRAGLSGAALLDDFADEVNDLVEMAGAPGQGGRSGLADLFQRHKVSQKYGADLTDDARAARNKSGDADLPDRAPLHERRAKFDSLAARRSAAASDGFASDGDADGFEDASGGRQGGKRGREAGGEEDEFYAAAREASRAKKAARQEAREGAGMVAPPAEDARLGGGAGRKISREIEKNRGLTPHRRKDIKNPRKKHRIKYGKAVVRRKGQVQDVRSGSAGYGGEATGIKSRVSKSRKF